MNSHLKWLMGMMGGSTTAFVNLDSNQDGEVQTNEIISAITTVTNEAFDDLPEGLNIKTALEEAKDPVLRLAAIEEFVSKFDLKNDTTEQLIEYAAGLIITALALEKKQEEAGESDVISTGGLAG